MTDELTWLQRWYSARCDGEWEHAAGITIETLDNPGWKVTIYIEDTEMECIPFEPLKTQVSETDWLHCRVQNETTGRYIAALWGMVARLTSQTSSACSESGLKPNGNEVVDIETSRLRSKPRPRSRCSLPLA